MDAEIIACCPICESPLEAEYGHADDNHEHDGKSGIHAHCSEHGAIYFH